MCVCMRVCMGKEREGEGRRGKDRGRVPCVRKGGGSEGCREGVCGENACESDGKSIRAVPQG